jgi:hypothetical protein
MQDGNFNKIEKELTCYVTVVWVLFGQKAVKPEAQRALLEQSVPTSHLYCSYVPHLLGDVEP